MRSEISLPHEELEEVAESTARVVVNRASFHLQQEAVQDFLRKLRKVLE